MKKVSKVIVLIPALMLFFLTIEVLVIVYSDLSTVLFGWIRFSILTWQLWLLLPFTLVQYEDTKKRNSIPTMLAKPSNTSFLDVQIINIV